MKSLICDLCNSDNRVLTYSVSPRMTNQRYDATLYISDGVSLNIPKTLEICNKCADEIHQQYFSLLTKFGLEKYV